MLSPLLCGTGTQALERAIAIFSFGPPKPESSARNGVPIIGAESSEAGRVCEGGSTLCACLLNPGPKSYSTACSRKRTRRSVVPANLAASNFPVSEEGCCIRAVTVDGRIYGGLIIDARVYYLDVLCTHPMLQAGYTLDRRHCSSSLKNWFAILGHLSPSHKQTPAHLSCPGSHCLRNVLSTRVTRGCVRSP